ncbi:hypothetical protein [Geminocystis sp. NIES-3709]|uniref:hypothetical protein n=1 Tax=Geminocystis sp. NIES-3709 TaxID=1617448 RepID=UPI0005FC6821|nr:hypothetical protein [Geminocystis sp. NIES-3709]BAQ66847.1 hypothetical protein GM3709_3612 [Geminocystis sp. NIES-3709]
MNNSNNSELIFPISPLIKITLLNLYFALTIPLPFLAKFTAVTFPLWLLWLLLILGSIVLIIVLSERVIINQEEIKVCYPKWVNWLWRKGWSLRWEEIDSLKMRTTGQGGLVYYFITKKKDKAYLLPMRVAGFNSMVTEVQNKTNIDTTDIRPLAQPWMYIFLLIFTFFLSLVDIWTISTALNGSIYH